jgi:ribose 5-phosphate isomerase B
MPLEVKDKLIILASDHNGVDLKTNLISALKERDYNPVDLGPYSSDTSVDYTDYAHQVAQIVASGSIKRGILVCGTGVGMSIVANRISGSRAALVHNVVTAEKTKEHNSSNILCLGAWINDDSKNIEILKKMHGPFITIEPQSNDEYCVNKKYPFAKWQDIVFDLQKKGVTIVQIGQSTNDHNLLGVINLTGKTSFREAALIIGKSQLFLSTDGGLMHASNAVETPAVIVYTGFVHPRLTGYLNNTNLWIGKPHGPCGYKTFCSKCFEETQDHDHNEIVEAVMNKLKRNS